MTFFRNLWADLVDKRLWPVALALLLALVAVPVLLLNGGGGDDHVDVAAAPKAGAGAQAVVAVDGTIKRVALHGSRRDPFAPSGGSDTTTTPTSASSTTGATTTSGPSTAGTSTTAGSSGTSSSGGTGSSGTSSSDSGSTGGGTSSTAVVVRFGTDDAAGKLRVVAPLEALPSRNDPAVVYLGPRDGQAVFLVSSDVTLDSKADCKPSNDVCQKTYVAPGTQVTLTTANVYGTTVKYVIEVVRAGS